MRGMILVQIYPLWSKWARRKATGEAENFLNLIIFQFSVREHEHCQIQDNVSTTLVTVT